MQVCPSCKAECDEGQLTCPADGTPLPNAGLVGRTLGDRYRVLGRIGQGGMGTVYLCEHVTLGKRMAVKVLRPEFSQDDELVRRFVHEARAASQIGQENIVDVFDFGQTPEGSAYFVMEALEGESLARILHREGPLPLGRALRIIQQICRALDAAHHRGIVHRDLKPENVFVLRRPDGTDFVKVLDFGISKSAMSPDARRITRAGSVIGTPEYMSPEQAAGTGADPRSDVYSLGVLAYEALGGRLPFEGETPLATLLKHQSETPLPLRRMRPELSLEVEAVVMRMLSKRPEGRPPTMADVASELARAVAGVDVDARPTPVVAAPVVLPETQPRASRPPAIRGGTMPLVDLDEVLAASPPAPAGHGTPRPEPSGPEAVGKRRRHSQVVVAVVLGAFALALVGAVAVAVSARRGDEGGEAVATVASEQPPAPGRGTVAAPLPEEGAPAGAAAARTSEPGADATAGTARTAEMEGVRTPPPGSYLPMAEPPRVEPAPAPPVRTIRRRPPRAGPPGTGAGTGAEERTGENRGRAEDLIDPYR